MRRCYADDFLILSNDRLFKELQSISVGRDMWHSEAGRFLSFIKVHTTYPVDICSSLNSLLPPGVPWNELTLRVVIRMFALGE